MVLPAPPVDKAAMAAKVKEHQQQKELAAKAAAVLPPQYFQQLPAEPVVVEQATQVAVVDQVTEQAEH